MGVRRQAFTSAPAPIGAVSTACSRFWGKNSSLESHGIGQQVFQILRFRRFAPDGNQGGHHALSAEENSPQAEYFSSPPNEMTFIFHGERIVICSTIDPLVSKCGRFGALLLACCHCYVAHFQCEQELNSTCSRSNLVQHTRWRRDPLLSNASLTFHPKEVSGIRPLAQRWAPFPKLIAGTTSIRSRDDGYSLLR